MVETEIVSFDPVSLLYAQQSDCLSGEGGGEGGGGGGGEGGGVGAGIEIV